MTGEAGRRQGGYFLPLQRRDERNGRPVRPDRSIVDAAPDLSKLGIGKSIFDATIEMYTSIKYKSITERSARSAFY